MKKKTFFLELLARIWGNQREVGWSSASCSNHSTFVSLGEGKKAMRSDTELLLRGQKTSSAFSNFLSLGRKRIISSYSGRQNLEGQDLRKIEAWRCKGKSCDFFDFGASTEFLNYTGKEVEKLKTSCSKISHNFWQS